MKSDEITRALKEAGLLGTRLIPADFKPSATLQVKYPETQVRLGNVLPLLEVRNAPHVNWYLEERIRPSHTLTLLMLDPDSPSRDAPLRSPMLYWAQSGLFSDGGPHMPSLAPYRGPGPPKGTGRHRYVFLLYQEPLPNEVEKPGVQLPSDIRHSFEIEQFVHSNKLHLISANFFAAESD